MKNLIAKINKVITVSTLMILFMTSLTFASTNYRFLTEEEIANTSYSDEGKQHLRKTRIVNVDEKVYDYADLFSDSEEVELKNQIDNYIAKTNYDLFIVTIVEPNNYDYLDEVYVDDFYDYNGFGLGQYHDGVGIIINIRDDMPGNRYIYATTTGNAILTYDDNRLEDLVGTFASGAGFTYSDSNYNYANGVKAYINSLGNYYDIGTPSSNRDAYINENGEYVYESGYHRKQLSTLEKIKEAFMPLFIITVIATLIFFFVNKGKLNNKKAVPSASYYLDKDSVNYTRKDDTFVSTHTTSYKIESSSSGGGSSTHHSSSGGSHGGGGGHF